MNRNTASKRSLTAAALLCGCSTFAQAQVDEDGSAAFKASTESLGAALGLPAAESTITTHDSGMTSATVGVEGLKALVVRQNPDGSVSFEHVGSAGEARDFLAGKTRSGREEW